MPPEMDVSIWYLWTEKGQAGPYSLRQLRNMLQQGRITAEFNVWREGLAGWTPIGGVAEFSAPTAEPVVTSPSSPVAAPPPAAPGPRDPGPAAGGGGTSIRPARRERRESRASLLSLIPYRLIIFLAVCGAIGYLAWPYFRPSPAFQTVAKFSRLVMDDKQAEARKMAKDEAFAYLLRLSQNAPDQSGTVLQAYWKTWVSEETVGDRTTVTFLEGAEKMPRGGGPTALENHRVSVTVTQDNGQWKVMRFDRQPGQPADWYGGLHRIRQFTSNEERRK